MSKAIASAAGHLPPVVQNESVEELLAYAEGLLDAGHREAGRLGGSDREECVRAIAFIGAAVMAAGAVGHDEAVQDLLDATERIGIGRASRPADYPYGEQLYTRLHDRLLELHRENGRRERAAAVHGRFVHLALETAGEIASALDAIDGTLLRGPARR